MTQFGVSHILCESNLQSHTKKIFPDRSGWENVLNNCALNVSVFMMIIMMTIRKGTKFHFFCTLRWWWHVSFCTLIKLYVQTLMYLLITLYEWISQFDNIKFQLEFGTNFSSFDIASWMWKQTFFTGSYSEIFRRKGFRIFLEKCGFS